MTALQAQVAYTAARATRDAARLAEYRFQPGDVLANNAGEQVVVTAIHTSWNGPRWVGRPVNATGNYTPVMLGSPGWWQEPHRVGVVS